MKPYIVFAGALQDSGFWLAVVMFGVDPSMLQQQYFPPGKPAAFNYELLQGIVACYFGLCLARLCEPSKSAWGFLSKTFEGGLMDSPSCKTQNAYKL